MLRGRFEWAVEVVPCLRNTPRRYLGAGVTPLTWRWNFDPRGRVAPYVELAGGLLWTENPVPAQTTTANFTAHAAYGVRYFFRPRQAFVARLHSSTTSRTATASKATRASTRTWCRSA